jgi:hypothetical protein
LSTFDDDVEFPAGEIIPLRPAVDVKGYTLRKALGLEVVGASTEQPTLIYINADNSTGLMRPALEPEVRMWKLLEEMWD